MRKGSKGKQEQSYVNVALFNAPDTRLSWLERKDSMSYQQTPNPNNSSTPKPDVNATPTPNVDATPTPIVDATPIVNGTPRRVVDVTPKPIVSTTPKSTAAPLPVAGATPPLREDQPRKRRGFLLPLLLLLLLLALLFGIFQFFTSNNRSTQIDPAVASSQTATARAQGGATSSASLTATAVANSQVTATAVANAGAGGVTLAPPAFNNIGARNDDNSTQANFDGSGDSYSTQALQDAKIVPGQTVTVNGVNFKWPDVASGKENNYQAQGQVIPVSPVSGATVIAFLGASSNGPSVGKGTLTYTDGTKQDFDLKFTDWTTRAGKISVSAENHVAATMPYRNKAGQKETVNTYLFSTEIALTAGKTIRSVTLPSSTDKGELHVFSVGTR